MKYQSKLNTTMKKIYFTTLFFFSFLYAIGQVNIGNGRGAGNLWVANHSEKTFDRLKTTKTFFALPDVCNKKELKEIIKSVWTFNEISFVTFDEIKSNKRKYISSDNILIYLRDMDFTVSKGIETVGYFKKVVFLVSTYKNVQTTKKGEIKSDFLDIAEIYLSKDIVQSKDGEDTYCLQLGLIKNYFQELNMRLTNSQNLKMNDGIVKKEKLGALSRKTLYIPWKIKSNGSTEEVENHKKFISKTFKNFEHPYELISNDELNEKIINGEDFFYLNDIQFSKFKILSISNSKTGEIIYLNVESNYRVKNSDMNKISNIISKNS